jgi:hypothetical protein
MNIIDTSLITDPSKQQPFLGGSLAFLQNASKEMIVGICRSIMGETLYNSSGTVAVCMAGCDFNNTLDTVYNGYIFFNGELYYFAGQTGLNSFSNDPVMVLNTAYLSPDPITFSDLSTGNVHQQRRLQCTDAVLGSGLFNLKDMKYVNSGIESTVTGLTATTSSASAMSIAGATYTTPKGITGLTRKFKIRIQGVVICPSAAAGEGAIITIRNATTSTDVYSITIGTADLSASIGISFFIEYKTGAVAADTNFIARLQRNATANVSLTGVWTIEEYN